MIPWRSGRRGTVSVWMGALQGLSPGVQFMHLELDSADLELLRRVLERHLGNLRMEISNTENFDWRRSLHADEDRLKALLAKLL